MEKVNKEYLARLRRVMQEKGVDCVIVSGTDPHHSELPPAHWRGREWLTGFWSGNGTNGTAVVTADSAYCWTDNRFFIQAAEQLQGTGFEMMKEDGPDAVDLMGWVADNLKPGRKVAIDGMMFSVDYVDRLKQRLEDKSIELDVDFPLFDYIQPDRPERPKNKLFVHDEQVVGENVESHIRRILEQVHAEKADAILLSALDDIAWATNVRTAGDIAFSPIFVSYLYLDSDRKVLFVDDEKLTDEVRKHLDKYGIEVKGYDEVPAFVAQLPESMTLLIDPSNTAQGIYEHIGCSTKFGGAGVARLKSIKNERMLANLETAMEKDGVALTRFFMMVEREWPDGELSEVMLGQRLRELRMQDADCYDESFAAIIGWNAHGAICHYEATPETDFKVVGDGLLLVDSGGQYIYGTTDITRTIALGEPTADEIHDYTLVLKGHIGLSTAHFPAGTRGDQIDAFARMPLWKEGKTYYHGTGHGVGFFINCHEGPQSIRTQHNPVVLEPGMVTSNEPGLYLEGRYGIRLENMLAIVDAGKTEFGQFYKFRDMTLFPFDSRLIDVTMLTAEELKWVNDYHAKVRERLLPLLDEQEGKWLTEKTKAL